MADVNETRTAVKPKSTMIKDALILFAITLIAAVALGFVYEITKDPIAQAQAEAKTKAYKKVFAGLEQTTEDPALAAEVEAAEEFLAQYPEYVGSKVNEALVALDASGKKMGYVFSMSNSKGYGGEIRFAMGVAADGKLMGLEFLKLSETAGLGMKAKDETFTSQFFGVQVGQFSLAKAKLQGDTEIDAISSATITTKAVARGVNAGLKFAQHLLEGRIGGVANE